MKKLTKKQRKEWAASLNHELGVIFLFPDADHLDKIIIKYKEWCKPKK